MAELDFELEIRKTDSGYELNVISSPAGETTLEAPVPFDPTALQLRLQALEIALLRSGGTRRRLPTTEEKEVQTFGQELFDWLIQGQVRSLFDVSRTTAKREGKALRVKLRFDTPALASLPWEFLYDPRYAEYVVLSTSTPLVRYMELPDPIEPLTVTPPLRILGLIASPNDLPTLDGQRERHRVDEATRELQERGLLEVHWLKTGTWRELQAVLRRQKWHIFHFVGHGGFDPATDEGMIALVNDEGGTFHLGARELGRLLGDHQPLRLAVLNACEGAKGSQHDLFSSTAATILRRGTPAVVAMQYEITDGAAIEFSRSFYEAIADGTPVDIGLSEARKAVSVAIGNTLEWGTPVLFMRAPDGVLFRVRKGAVRKPRPVDIPPADETGTQPVPATTPGPGPTSWWRRFLANRWAPVAGVLLAGALTLAIAGIALWPRGGGTVVTKSALDQYVPTAIRLACAPFGFSELTVYGYTDALRCPVNGSGVVFVKYAYYPDQPSLNDQWDRRMTTLKAKINNGGCWNGRAGETAWENGRLECNLAAGSPEVRWMDTSAQVYGTVLGGPGVSLSDVVEWWSATAVVGGATQ